MLSEHSTPTLAGDEPIWPGFPARSLAFADPLDGGTAIENASGRHQLFLVRPDGTDGRQLTTEATAGMGLCCATWSPDGGSLVFQGGPDATATLFTMALDATVATPLREEVGAYAQPAWR